MVIDPQSKTPLAAQVEQWIIDKIAGGEYRIGEKIPSESELATELQVSRPTIKRAVNNLVAQGLLSCHPCIGSFVKRLPAPSSSLRYVGVILPDLADPFLRDLANQIGDRLAEQGYMMILGESRRDAAREEGLFKTLLRQDAIRGYIIDSPFRPAVLGKRGKPQIPAVYVCLAPPAVPADFVGIDTPGAVQAVVDYLAGLGHKQIGYVSGKIHAAEDNRRNIFTDILRQRGLDIKPEWTIASPFADEAGGRDGMRRLLQVARLPTAVFTESDTTAIGLMQVAVEHGLNIPADLSVVGFDNIHAAAHLPTPLTTVDYATGRLASRAVDLLMRRIESRDVAASSEKVMIAPRLIVRQSCAAPAARLDRVRPQPVRRKPGQMHIGIIGLKRGLSLKAGLESLPEIRVHAVCDHNVEALDQARKQHGIQELYFEFEDMLGQADLDALVIATPWHQHARQALIALAAGRHVISEVPAAATLDQARELAAACRTARGLYLMAENALYLKETALVRELVRAGLFGTPYYAEGEYIHNLKNLAENKAWWKDWLFGLNGITYGTHPLGPILSWMAGDRVASVSCAGSGRHYRDPAGKPYEREDTCAMLCRMRSGNLAAIRMDVSSNRPHATTNFSLQGTEGAYESSRLDDGHGRIWLKSRCKDPEAWLALESLEAEFLPEVYRQAETVRNSQGFDRGCDYITGRICAEILTGKRTNELNVDAALDLTLPGLISQQSIAQGGQWLEVPDSRKW